MAERKSAEDRKQEIVLAVLKQADKVGPDRLSASMIAREIGISQPAIFRHFPGMKDLWLAVAAHIGSVMKKKWEKALDPEENPPEQLKKLVMTQLRFIQTVPAVPGILFSRELHAGNKGLRQAFFGIMGALHRRITQIVIEGQKTGHFYNNNSPEDSAFLIISFIQGLIVRWSISGKSFNLAEEGERLWDMQMKIFCEERSIL